MVNKKEKSKDKVHSIRFDEETFMKLNIAASKENMPFATFVKSAANAYADAANQGDKILKALNPQEPEAAKQVLLDAVQDLKKVIQDGLGEKDEAIIKALKEQNELLRLMMYVQLYYSRDLPEEHKDSAQRSALNRQKKLLAEFDRKVAEGRL